MLFFLMFLVFRLILLQYMNHEQQPYGVNAVVAIMCYTGYNVEDAILVNKAALDRGMFRTTYYTTYTSRESSASVAGDVNSKFANVSSLPTVIGLKEGVDYSHLDEYGMIREGTAVTDKMASDAGECYRRNINSA